MITLKSHMISIIGIIFKKNSTSFYHSLVSKKNKIIEIVQFTEYATIDELLSCVKNSIPVVVNIIGDNVIYTKKNNLLINNNFDEYYITTYLTKNKIKFSAITRKDYINKLTQKLTSNRLYVIGIIVGVLPISNLFKKVFNENEITIEGKKIFFNDEELTDVKNDSNNNSNLSVDSQTKNILELLSFSIGINYFKPNNQLIYDVFNDKKIEFKHKIQFEQILKIGSGLFLFVVILNFIFNFYYNTQITKISLENSKNIELQKEYDYLKAKENKKNRLIQVSGLLNPTPASYYINDIGAIIPKKITLDEMIIFPIAKKNNKTILIKSKQIDLSGLTQTNKSFNIFLETLRNKEWLDKINIISYKNEANNISKFKIELILK